MIVGFVENGEVRVYENLPQAMDEWAEFPIDLLSDAIVLYDDDGTWLKPVASYAPREWFPWLKRLVAVEMIRSDPSDEPPDELGYLLHHEAVSVVPNSVVGSLDELRQRYPWNA